MSPVVAERAQGGAERRGGGAVGDGIHQKASLLARDEHVLVVLAGAPAGAAVHVPAQPLVELEPGALEDLRVEVAAVVDDDEHAARRARARRRRSRAPRAMPSRYASSAARDVPALGGAELELAPVVEAEQLVRVPVLLVVVDQARVRRRGERRRRTSSAYSTSRASPWRTRAPRARRRGRAANASMRASVSSV